jgi:hypothetical protein
MELRVDPSPPRGRLPDPEVNLATAANQRAKIAAAAARVLSDQFLLQLEASRALEAKAEGGHLLVAARARLEKLLKLEHLILMHPMHKRTRITGNN